MGQFSLPYLNRSFAPVSLVATFDSSKIQIDTLTVGASANLSGDITLEDFRPDTLNLSAKFRDFEPIAWPELQLKTNGDLEITGTLRHPIVKGELTMTQAEIRLAKLLETPTQEMPDFLKAVKMDLKLSADRRVWVRDPTFELEVVGDVSVETDHEGLRIYGTMASRRGNYILQNRRMRITQGEIQFQDWPTNNPTLDIRAETIVRGVVTQGAEAEPIAIAITVGGKVTYPQV